MDLDELRAFLAVAQSGSLTAAAEESQMVRSTLARRVAALERRLGLRLLRETPYGLALTTSGMRLAEDGPRVLKAAESAEAMVLETESP